MFRRFLLLPGTLCSRLCNVRKPTITRGISIALFVSVLSLIGFSYYVSNFHQHHLRNVPQAHNVKCHVHKGAPHQPQTDHHSRSSNSLRTETKVLVFVETQYSKPGKLIIALLEANRFRFKIALAGKGLPYLTHSDKGKFGAVIFESMNTYLDMDSWNRQILDKYCRQYKVGMVLFSQSHDETPLSESLLGFPIKTLSNLALKDYEINPVSDLLRVTRAGETFHGALPEDNWTIFVHNNSNYLPVAFARTRTRLFFGTDDSVRHTTVLQDLGTTDGIQRVFFGNSVKFWVHRLLLLDALSYLSHGKFSISLDRYIQIDIDDIFVGKPGIRMKPEDVQALESSQERLGHSIDGFHFNLGFSGHYYRAGLDDENLGDEMLIERRHSFWWFGHTWRHYQPHQAQTTEALVDELMHNRDFAEKHGIPVNQSYAVAPHHSGVYPVHEPLYEKHGIPVNQSYAVAPHHSGVYPVHEPLYEAWRRVWDVRVTSTEEYPHLHPARYRRGFIHRGIKVLPRQTCGLFTHTIFLDKYPGGRQRLDQSIMGGELFQTIVYNPISIFMTHLSNYGNDRIALYTFENVIKFLKCWTNFKFRAAPPVELAEIYFNKFPEEVQPIWQNPCDDPRHLEIWSSKKSCSRLPSFLVIGPQKTGTTALYTFLAMHPVIRSNLRSQDTFEEVQFFNGKNYYKGIDWYMEFFPPPNSSESQTVFEKSANYFDNEMVPMRAHALLPNAKLITILLDPSKRAYSWYQHMRAHGDAAALQFSFDDVVMADESAPRSLRSLRHRCLNPGLYATHLERWLDFYPAKQLLVLDGEVLKSHPVSVMERVQRFLHISPYFDYEKHLRYNPKKGFFCQVLRGDHTKCLGRSKGRQYPPMTESADKYLRTWYKRANVQLSKMLSRLGQQQPEWLQGALAHN